MRCDFNVPQDGNRITDDGRIKAALPTIQYLLEKGGKLVLCSHMGRPDGQVNPKYSLVNVAARLQKLLGRDVPLIEDCIGSAVDQAKAGLQEGDVILLENLRFHPEEEANDKSFAKKLAKGCDVFVNDAFGTAHRAHASTEGVTRYLPAYAGFLIEKEIEFLGSVIEDPEKPFVVVLGGAKVADKIPVIERLLPLADKILIGGGMAFTFLKAKGLDIGKSLLDEKSLDFVTNLMAKHPDKLMIPADVNTVQEITEDALNRVVPVYKIPRSSIGVDIGPLTAGRYMQVIMEAKTVIWNGPMGIFEILQFSQGTRAIAEAMSESSAITVVGGGDTAAAIEFFKMSDQVSHVSTGGGASLEFLEGRELPGISSLLDA